MDRFQLFIRVLFLTYLVCGCVCFSWTPVERLGCAKSILDKTDEDKCPGGYAWICSHLKFNKVPTVFPKYNASSKLCLLDLSWNNLKVIKNSSFQNLMDLRWLSLDQNNISFIETNAFAGLSNLYYLNLSTNMLIHPKGFAKGVFNPLRNLEYLNLKNNPIKSYNGLDGLLKPLRKLTGLLITGCYNCSFGTDFKDFVNLTSLSLSGSLNGETCYMSILFNWTFTNVPNLSQLFLSFCNIRTLRPAVFSPLKKLITLDISYNKKLHFIGMQRVLAGLKNSSIVKLDVSAIYEPHEMGTKLLAKYIKPIKDLKTLERLYMELNKIEVIAEEVFNYIPNSTTHFSLAGNRLTYGEYVFRLTGMNYMSWLDISRQHLNYDPFLQKHQEQMFYRDTVNLGFNHFKDDENKIIHPQVEFKSPKTKIQNTKLQTLEPTKEISTSKNNMSNVRVLPLECILDEFFNCPSNMMCVCVPGNLEIVEWRASFLYVHVYGLRIFKPNRLRRINLSFNLIELWEGPVDGLEELEDFNLAENICTQMNSTFFDNFYGLRKLNISYNFLGQVLDPAKENAGEHFKNLRNLTHLDLSDNRISAAAYDLFENLESLQYLNISRNMLTKWDFRLNSKCLRLLDLSDNKLETIPESLRNYLEDLAGMGPHETCNRTDVLILDLAGNPIQCNCENRPFLRWLSKSKVKILFYGTDECHLRDGSRLTLWNEAVIPDFVDKLDTECIPYAWIGASIGIFVVSLGMSAAVYRYRWKLRYLYYIGGRRRHRHSGYNRLFERDAFIAYANSEASFIKDKLVPGLEGVHDLKVWVADRDSQVGASIATNLTHAIHSCKKSVLLLTRQYLKEDWCDYEMNMARVESVESRRNLMIIVKFGEVSMKDMPLDYLRLLKMDNVRTIEYPTHPQDMDTFWASLAEAIREE